VYQITINRHTCINHKKVVLVLSIYEYTSCFSHTDCHLAFKYITFKPKIKCICVCVCVCVCVCIYIYIYMKVKVKFTLEQATKAQRGSIVLLFL